MRLDFSHGNRVLQFDPGIAKGLRFNPGRSVSMRAIIGTGPQGLPGPGAAAWTALQAVTIASVRQAPDGSWIRSNADRVTRASFDPTEQTFWDAIMAADGTIESDALDARIVERVAAVMAAAPGSAGTNVTNLNALFASGAKEIHLRPGELYDINAALEFQADARVVGNGATIRLTADVANLAAIAADAENVTVTGITFDANNHVAVGGTLFSHAGDGSNWRVERCTIKNTGGDPGAVAWLGALYFKAGTHITLADNTIDNCPSPILVGQGSSADTLTAQHVTIHHNTITNFIGKGIECRGGTLRPQTFRVTDNHVSEPVIRFTGGGVTFKTLTSMVATLETATAHGLVIGSEVIIAGVADAFNGYYHVATVPSTTTFTYALDEDEPVIADVPRTAATGTVSPSANAAPIWIDGRKTEGGFPTGTPTNAIHDVVVSGNTALGNDTTTDTGDLIRMRGVEGGKMFGNLSSNGGDKGFTVSYGSRDVEVFGNTIERSDSDAVVMGFTDPLFDEAVTKCYNLAVHGNTIRDCGLRRGRTNALNYGVRAQNGHGYSIVGNVMWDSSATPRVDNIVRIMPGVRTVEVRGNQYYFVGTQPNSVRDFGVGRDDAALTTRGVVTKALTSNVATLTTRDAHNFYVGVSAIVAGVDATFDGTYTVTGVPTTTTFTYAKTASNVSSTAATGTVKATLEASDYLIDNRYGRFRRRRSSINASPASPLRFRQETDYLKTETSGVGTVTAKTWTLPPACTFKIRAEVVYTRSDMTHRGFYNLDAIYYRNGTGNVTLQTTVVSVSRSSTAVCVPTLVIDTGAQTVRLDVTSDQAAPVDWECDLKWSLIVGV